MPGLLYWTMKFGHCSSQKVCYFVIHFNSRLSFAEHRRGDVSHEVTRSKSLSEKTESEEDDEREGEEEGGGGGEGEEEGGGGGEGGEGSGERVVSNDSDSEELTDLESEGDDDEGETSTFKVSNVFPFVPSHKHTHTLISLAVGLCCVYQCWQSLRSSGPPWPSPPPGTQYVYVGSLTHRVHHNICQCVASQKGTCVYS